VGLRILLIWQLPVVQPLAEDENIFIDNYSIVLPLCINVMQSSHFMPDWRSYASDTGIRSIISERITLTLLYPSLDTVLPFRGRILRRSAFPEIQFALVKSEETGPARGGVWSLSTKKS
jgi:hypothetical protein